MKVSRKFIIIFVLVATAIRILDGLTDILYFSRGPYPLSLSQVIFHEVFDAFCTFAIIIGCGILVAKEIKKRTAAESELEKANDDLEERSDQLWRLNEHLEDEVKAHLKTIEAKRESENRIRSLSSQLLDAQEKERREISGKLHDDLGQTLALLKQHVWRVQKKLKTEDTDLADEVEEILRCIGEAIENVRNMSWNLSPHLLEYCGLSSALHKLIENISKLYEFQITTDLINIDHKISKEFHIVVYRIIQEALNNIGKHAFATHLNLLIKESDHHISFLVEDNGRGYDLNDTLLGGGRGGGLGLAILDERVKMLGGQLDIRSREGKGTRLSFSIPLQSPSGE